MAVNASVKNYLDSLVNYYQVGQAAQAAQQPGQRAAAGIPLGAVLGLGGNVGGGGSNTTTFIAGGAEVMGQARAFQREDRDDTRATNAAWIGGILLLIVSGGLACACSSWNENSKRLEEATDFRDNILTQLPLNHQNQLRPIVTKDIRNLENKDSQYRNITLLTGSVLASAATAFAGGMLAIQWLITAAIIVGVVTAAIGVFLTVYYCLQKSETPQGIMEYLQANPQMRV